MLGIMLFSPTYELRYRIVDLTPDTSMAWLKDQIAQDYDDKQRLNMAMEEWYGNGKKGRFPALSQLEQVTAKLSRMDSSYKRLWDVYGQ
ncbi:MAG: hypothetical protein ABL913_04125 [Methyloglobulus sp.]